jgi:hypothetical protein
MEVSKIHKTTADGTCVLHGEITSQFLAEPFLVWYEFPSEVAPYIDARFGDPFVPAALVSAMRCGEPLEIPAPVSPRLLAATDQIQSLYCSFDPSLNKIAVRAAQAASVPASATERARRAALTFSLGVDSWYSLLRNSEEHPADDWSIEYLIHVYGFDLRVGGSNRQALEEIRASCQHVAGKLGKRLLPVRTNLRDFTDRFADWSLLGHGAGVASVGLALAGFIDRLHIAAGPTIEDPTPCGSHPQLDPLWSTERLQVVYDGGEARRSTKIQALTGRPLALETLRVCYQDPPKQYNCCRCWKCLSTMIRLEINGALGRATAFPLPLSAQLIRDAEIEPVTPSESLESLLSEVRKWGKDQALADALAERVEERVRERPITRGEIDFMQSRVSLLAPLQYEVARLTAEMDRQTLWAQRCVHDIGERDAIIRELQTQVAEMTAWAQRSVRDVTERDALIRALQSQIPEQEDRSPVADAEPGSPPNRRRFGWPAIRSKRA